MDYLYNVDEYRFFLQSSNCLDTQLQSQESSDEMLFGVGSKCESEMLEAHDHQCKIMNEKYVKYRRK